MASSLLDLSQTGFCTLEQLALVRQIWALPLEARETDIDEETVQIANELHHLIVQFRDGWAAEACQDHPQTYPNVQIALGEFLPNVILHGHHPVITRRQFGDNTRFRAIDIADSAYFDSRVTDFIHDGKRIHVHKGRAIIENAVGEENYILRHLGRTFKATLWIRPQEIMASRL